MRVGHTHSSRGPTSGPCSTPFDDLDKRGPGASVSEAGGETPWENYLKAEVRGLLLGVQDRLESVATPDLTDTRCRSSERLTS